MNKQIIIEKIVERLEKRINDLEQSIKETQQAVISSPNPMQSWSDTSRFQLRSLIANLQPRIDQLKKCIEEIKKINTEKVFKKVEIGALIKTKENKKERLYFITPVGSGTELLKLKNGQVIALSVDSPLAQKLSNKQSGEIIKFDGPNGHQEITILEIL